MPYHARAGVGGSGWTFLREFLSDLRHNLRVSLPFLGILLLYWVVASSVLFFSEHGKNHAVTGWGDALYLTWVTMTTIGNPGPVSLVGRLITALDGFAGLVLIGVVLWFVTKALERK
jgi:hypothetical protein